ncbi:MAG: hypothetical protein ACTTHG_06595 [Treponemataceae bacterium]
MDVFLNEQKIEITLEKEENLRDVLNEFQKNCEENNATIVDIQLNGINLTCENMDEYGKTEISKIKELKISSVSKDDIVNSFCNIKKMIPEIETNLAQVSVNLQTEKDNLAFETVKQFTNFFDYFCKAITLSALFPDDFSSYVIDGKNVLEFLNDFSPILKDLESALEEKDSVLMGDLAEYEILPRIEQIKIFLELFNN